MKNRKVGQINNAGISKVAAIINTIDFIIETKFDDDEKILMIKNFVNSQKKKI